MEKQNYKADYWKYCHSHWNAMNISSLCPLCPLCLCGEERTKWETP